MRLTCKAPVTENRANAWKRLAEKVSSRLKGHLEVEKSASKGRKLGERADRAFLPAKKMILGIREYFCHSES